MSDQTFFETAEDWSRRKHVVLMHYLKPAAAKLRKASSDGRVFVLDGFAGQGQYADGTPGSPLCVGQLADECRRFANPLDLRIYNAEPDGALFKALQESTRRWVDLGVMVNLNTTFEEALPKVLRAANQSPLFAFLDPFRPSHLPLDHSVPLLTRRAKTEVLFVLHTPGILRILAATRPSARTLEATKRGHTTVLDRIFGDGCWRSLLDSRGLRPQDVVNCFCRAVCDRCSHGVNYVFSHAINARHKVGLKYHVVFWTRHPDGVRLMNNAFCKESEIAHEEGGSYDQPPLFVDETVSAEEMFPHQRHQVIAETLVEIGARLPGKRWKRSDLVLESIRARFGQFRETDHLAAVNLLLSRQSSPRLRVHNGRQTKAGRWITNDHSLLSFE